MNNYAANELIKLAKEYFEQDNRSTAYPVYFTIRDRAWEPSCHFEEGERFTMVWDCESVCSGETLSELFGEILKEKENYGFKMPRHMDLEYIDQDDCKEFERINDTCQGIFSDKKTWVEKNMFLFSEEAKQHLKANDYHYSSEAHTYGNHAWRAPKTEKLFELLKELSND